MRACPFRQHPAHGGPVNLHTEAGPGEEFAKSATTPARDGPVCGSLVKSLGGMPALRGVSLTVGRGEIVALLGENGAGKSTVIKVSGASTGRMPGRLQLMAPPYVHVAGRSGGQAVAFIHQDLGLLEWMSVAQNIALARGYRRRGRRIDWAATEAMAGCALALVDADFPSTRREGRLSRTQKSLVAIARALTADRAFLVLDEPTASLPADEVGPLFSALRPLKAKGVA